MKPLLAAVLGLLAVAHLLLPLTPLVEARAIDPELARLLLVELRLPRTLLVLVYGATLGISGAALQAVFANRLASPDLSGSSSGAALGAVLGGYWLGLSAPLALAACGAVGALLALGLLLLLAGRRPEPSSLLLAGLAISLLGGAATSLALALAPSPFAFYDAFDWLMGNFTDRSLAQALAAALPALAAGLFLLGRARALDLTALGDDAAAALGVRPRRLAVEVMIASGIAVGACVAVAGAVGFVGLIAPFAARAIERGHPGRALAASAMIGAMLLALADLVVRTIPLDRPIPVGVLTALVGAPLLLWLIARDRGRMAA